MVTEEGLEWICMQNRTGKIIDDLPEIANSGLVLYELKIRLNSCVNCDDYTSHEGQSYCLKRIDKYKEMAKRL